VLLGLSLETGMEKEELIPHDIFFPLKEIIG
jgi:hypothetical protein